jgi:hypothetical protein
VRGGSGVRSGVIGWSLKVFDWLEGDWGGAKRDRSVGKYITGSALRVGEGSIYER